MRLLNLSDSEIDKLYDGWKTIPVDVKKDYEKLFFNIVDNKSASETNYYTINSLIKKYNPKEESNIQYVNYNEGQFKYMDKLYSMNKPQKFILNLINKAKQNKRLTKAQNYYLIYYLKNGETPYDAKLLPNNI